MMGDMGDVFRCMSDHSANKKRNNNISSTKILELKGVDFESKNNGVHLIVKGIKDIIDFWPSTGKFITRKGKKGRGVFNLLKLCETTKKLTGWCGDE